MTVGEKSGAQGRQGSPSPKQRPRQTSKSGYHTVFNLYFPLQGR